jgi:hypothetical protein
VIGGVVVAVRRDEVEVPGADVGGQRPPAEQPGAGRRRGDRRAVAEVGDVGVERVVDGVTVGVGGAQRERQLGSDRHDLIVDAVQHRRVAAAAGYQGSQERQRDRDDDGPRGDSAHAISSSCR